MDAIITDYEAMWPAKVQKKATHTSFLYFIYSGWKSTFPTDLLEFWHTDPPIYRTVKAYQLNYG